MRIAFTGKKLAGKSEACKAIIKAFPEMQFTVIDMVERVRRAIIKMAIDLGVKVNLDHFYKEKTPESRLLMQAVGGYLRSIDNDILVKHACQKIDLMRKDARMNWLVENMRMLNEETTFKERGFKVVRIIRSNLKSNDKHITETEMDAIKPDYTIYNDKSLAEFHRNVITVVKAMYAIN